MPNIIRLSKQVLMVIEKMGLLSGMVIFQLSSWLAIYYTMCEYCSRSSSQQLTAIKISTIQTKKVSVSMFWNQNIFISKNIWSMRSPSIPSLFCLHIRSYIFTIRDLSFSIGVTGVGTVGKWVIMIDVDLDCWMT